jgi:hypothetical protein
LCADPPVASVVAASTNAVAFSVTIRVFSAFVPRPRARRVSRIATTLCASIDSIAASIENFHQGANINSSGQRGLNNPLNQKLVPSSWFEDDAPILEWCPGGVPHRVAPGGAVMALRSAAESFRCFVGLRVYRLSGLLGNLNRTFSDLPRVMYPSGEDRGEVRGIGRDRRYAQAA